MFHSRFAGNDTAAPPGAACIANRRATGPRAFYPQATRKNRTKTNIHGYVQHKSGRIIDRRHPQSGELVSGRILMMAAGRGSSSGSAALAEALRLGVGPAAILLLRRDAIVIVGALAAMELYGRACPVALAAAQDWAALAAARWLDGLECTSPRGRDRSPGLA